MCISQKEDDFKLFGYAFFQPLGWIIEGVLHFFRLLQWVKSEVIATKMLCNLKQGVM
jgi:hypothetical protein